MTSVSTDPINPDVDVHKIDQGYRPFRSFSEWHHMRVDEAHWASMKERVANLTSKEAPLLERALRIARRAAAVETGAIEELYKSDRGVTMTIATEAASWQSALEGTGQRQLIHDQLDAYEGLLDLATKKMPFTEAGIRELHSRLCQSQGTYHVQTPLGPQQQKLPLGEYKHHPNHIRKSDGTFHAWAPVDLVNDEMHRLITALNSEEFGSAHPVVQAAYAHHAFVTIHPFADGNGRVSRAIASVFLYRNAKIPFLFFYDQRKSYYSALSAADNSDYLPWIGFVFEAGIQTMLLVKETFMAARAPDLTESLNAIANLYQTKSGHTTEQIDTAASNLVHLITQEIRSQCDRDLKHHNLEFETQLDESNHNKVPQGYRNLAKGKRRVYLRIANQKPPANAVADVTVHAFVPKNPGGKDSIIFMPNPDTVEPFEARVDELLPSMTSGISIRLKTFVERLIAGTIHHLLLAAREAAERA